MRRTIVGGVSLVFFCAAALSGFAESHLALSAEASTLGPGGKGVVKLTDDFNVRFGGNGFSYDFDGKARDVEYKVKLHLMSFCALVDWFPFDGQGLRVTGGLIINKNRVNVHAEPSANYKLGDTTYTAAQVGSLDGKVKFRQETPYLGLGWGNPFGKESRWSFNADAGIMYQGSPHVSLSANGALASDPTFQANLEREKSELKDKVDRFRYYPVVAVAVTYRF